MNSCLPGEWAVFVDRIVRERLEDTWILFFLGNEGVIMIMSLRLTLWSTNDISLSIESFANELDFLLLCNEWFVLNSSLIHKWTNESLMWVKSFANDIQNESFEMSSLWTTWGIFCCREWFFMNSCLLGEWAVFVDRIVREWLGDTFFSQRRGYYDYEIAFNTLTDEWSLFVNRIESFANELNFL